MIDFNENNIEELVTILFDDKYFYNTNEWIEIQKILLCKMNKNNDFSYLATMMNIAEKREHYQLIEFICSHLSETWVRKLWTDIKPLIYCKCRDARYRGVRLHAYFSKDTSDYINILRCLNDEYQDVRLAALHWIIENNEVMFNLILENKLPNNLSEFKFLYQDTIDMSYDELLNYSLNNLGSNEKKFLFSIFSTKALSLNRLKESVDILDHQDIFDYFHRYLI